MLFLISMQHFDCREQRYFNGSYDLEKWSTELNTKHQTVTETYQNIRPPKQ